MKVVREGLNEVEIEIGECEHLWIQTPRGRIKVYVGRTWSSITSWVDDTDYAGFYTNNATKKTSPCNEQVQHITLRAKED
tara:strand:- start:478 stop:717 length:240 start_codon:yes stop_codon:yes gene_type:complete